MRLSSLCGHVGREHLGELVVLQTAFQELLLRQVSILVLVHSENKNERQYLILFSVSRISFLMGLLTWVEILTTEQFRF